MISQLGTGGQLGGSQIDSWTGYHQRLAGYVCTFVQYTNMVNPMP